MAHSHFGLYARRVPESWFGVNVALRFLGIFVVGFGRFRLTIMTPVKR